MTPSFEVYAGGNSPRHVIVRINSQESWKGAWECHIEPDWLLIWLEDEDDVVLVRTGTHSELF